jgi:hypothetical protein
LLVILVQTLSEVKLGRENFRGRRDVNLGILLIPDFIEKEKKLKREGGNRYDSNTYKTHHHPAMEASAAFEGRLQPENAYRIRPHSTKEFLLGALRGGEESRCREVLQARP